MVSTDLDPSCDNSESITINIPHIGAKRSFKKVSPAQSQKTSRSNNIFLRGDTSQGQNVQIDTISPANVAWEGQDPDDGSTFTFVQDEDRNMAGSLVDLTNHEVYQFYNEHDGSVSVTITKSNAFYPELDPDDQDLMADIETTMDADHQGNRNLRRKSSSFSTPSSHHVLDEAAPKNHDIITTQEEGTRRLNDDGSILDVMVVWTKQAECMLSNLGEDCTLTSQSQAKMINRINLAVTETNIAYASSGINTQLQLVHSYRHPSYIEEGMLTDLRNLYLGNVPGVHSNRSTYKADLVSFIVDDSFACGLAFKGPRFDLMYSITNWFCAAGNYSFGHEIGHNLGLSHDRGTANACNDKGRYNYGYRDPNANFRTIMAYNCKSTQCDNIKGDTCTRIGRFASSNLTFNGLATGTATEDAARVINEISPEVARYFRSVDSPTQSPTASASRSSTDLCIDSKLKFLIQWNGKLISRDCSWVGAKATNQRCKVDGVSEMCSVTCGTCATCKDSTARFTLDWYGEPISRDCSWVGANATKQRCKPGGVKDACRATCGLC